MEKFTWFDFLYLVCFASHRLKSRNLEEKIKSALTSHLDSFLEVVLVICPPELLVTNSQKKSDFCVKEKPLSCQTLSANRFESWELPPH